MVKGALNTARKESVDQMDYDLLWAAERGQIEHAKQAIKQDETCLKDENDLGMNALQLAIIHFHDEMALYLLQNTEISVRSKDVYGRDSLTLALTCSAPRVIELADEKWSEERCQEFVNRRSKVVGLTPKP